MQLYNAVVQPHFDYGDVIYDSALLTAKRDYKNYKQELLHSYLRDLIVGKTETLCLRY